MTTTPITHLAEPGLYHGPLEGHPAAGHAVLANCVPEVTLHLGEIAGRPVDLIVCDPAWLAELEQEVRLARSRLTEWLSGRDRPWLDGHRETKAQFERWQAGTGDAA